jgi:ParB/RepB/Spo0J family partition protein
MEDCGSLKLKIENIKIGARVRQDNGDLSQLKRSIREVGLLCPIIVNEKCELVSGYRRLEACHQLGWSEIEAKIMDTAEDKIKKLDFEFHENFGRLNLNEEEQKSYRRMRHELLHPPKARFSFFKWLMRIWQMIKSLFRQKESDSFEEYDYMQ